MAQKYESHKTSYSMNDIVMYMRNLSGVPVSNSGAGVNSTNSLIFANCQLTTANSSGTGLVTLKGGV